MAGYWSGGFKILGEEVQLTIHLTPGEGPTLVASVSLVDKGLLDVPADHVILSGRRIDMDLGVIGGAYSGRLTESGELKGDWVQAGGKFRLTLVRSQGPRMPNRPQHPKPAFPYSADSVVFPNSAVGLTLAGTLTLPGGAGPFPAAVLVSGSGPQDRDETIFGHKPFWVIADYLSRRGVAVLRYDDRGVASSTGMFSTATTLDHTSDALSAVAYLHSRPEIDPDRIGIIGHSEGGWVGPLAATKSEQVGFLVLMAPVGMGGADLLRLQTQLIMEAAGVPAPLMALNRRVQEEVLNSVVASGAGGSEELRRRFREAWGGLPFAAAQALGLAGRINQGIDEQMAAVASPWLQFFLTFDPVSTFEEVEVPVLALFGSKDLQVPPKPNLALTEAAFKRGRTRSITVVNFDELNHMFQHARTGSPTEYGAIEETISPEVLETIERWIHDNAGAGP